MYVERISYKDVVPFITNIHYARRIPCIQYAYGLFEDDKLVGVCTFGQSVSPTLGPAVAGEENRKNVLELNRLVFLPEYNGGNRGSYLVSHALKMLPNHTFVVSYADWGGWHHVGYVYQATNWLFTGMTKAQKERDCGERHARHYEKHEGGKTKLRTPKYRYLYLVGDKKTKRQMLREVRLPIYNEYPKGASEHYDTDNPMSWTERGE